MPGTTPSETLRSAAALMRERAEKAKAASSGPWQYRDGWIWDGVYERADVYGDGRAEFGEHVASWHPLAAIAVADLLDESAAYYESLSPTEAAFVAQAVGGDMDPGLKIARAYLGDGA